VRRLCAIAEVSRCGYYKYLRQGSEKQAENKRIGEMVLKIQEHYNYSIGSRKMVPLLEKEAGKKYGIRVRGCTTSAGTLFSLHRIQCTTLTGISNFKHNQRIVLLFK